MRLTLVCGSAERLPRIIVRAASTARAMPTRCPMGVCMPRPPGKARSSAMTATPLVATDMKPAMGCGAAS